MRYPKVLPYLFCLFCLISLPFAAAAAEAEQTPPPHPYPSEVFVEIPETVGDGTAFPCSFQASGLSAITVTFLKRTVTAQADENGRASVLLPIPLDHPSADIPLAWKARYNAGMDSSGTVTVKVRKKIYPAQHLTLAPKYVTPDPALTERIANERKLLNKALTTRSPVRHWELPMLRPLSGKVTSWYGLRRILNGQPRSPHKGLDFRGAEGTPISCIADGTVVLTGDFYYPGKFAVVDHGLGVTSIYMHMSEVSATNGQRIKRGDIVGLVGMTGRSTGPHLHLGITVLGQTIDAFPLLDMTPQDKAAYAEAFSNAAKAEGKAPAKKKSARGTKGGSAKKAAAGKNTAKAPPKNGQQGKQQ